MGIELDAFSQEWNGNEMGQVIIFLGFTVS